MKRTLSQRFLFYEEYFDAFKERLACSQNFIFTGRKGHAKTQMVDAFCEELGYVPWDPKEYERDPTQNFYFSVTVKPNDKLGNLFGMDLIEKDGVSRVEITFGAARHCKLVLLDEFQNVSTDLLEGLKQIALNRKFTNGIETVELPWISIVGMANSTKMELLSSNIDPARAKSMAAAVDRFPYFYEVEWPEYSAANFMKMFKLHPNLQGKPDMNKYDNTLLALARAIESSHANGVDETSFISPRSAMTYLTALLYRLRKGDDLKDVLKGSDMDVAIQQEFNRQILAVKNEQQVNAKILAFKHTYTTYLRNINVRNAADKGEVLEALYHIEKILEHIPGSRSDSNYQEIGNLKRDIEKAKKHFMEMSFTDSDKIRRSIHTLFNFNGK